MIFGCAPESHEQTGQFVVSTTSTPRMAGPTSRSSTRRSSSVKITAFDRFKPGVNTGTIGPLLRGEVAHVWRLGKARVARGELRPRRRGRDANALARAALAPDHRNVPR